jgi:hypothetical protein
MTSSLAAPELTIAPQVPPSRPVSRWLVAAVLVAGATLQLIEELIEPPIRDDGDRLEWIAGHATLHAVDIAIGLAAVPLLIASVPLLARLAGRRPCRPVSGTSGPSTPQRHCGTCTPTSCWFRDATLIRGGEETQASAVDPRRGDIVRPTR